MAILLAAIASLILPNHLNAQTLAWDNSEHSSFSLTFNHNMSQTLILNQITYDSQTYDLVDPIIVNATGSSSTLQAFFSFEDPIDDIKQAPDNSTTYRLSQYDYQSITRPRVDSLLNLVHNGSFKYDAAQFNHLLLDGTVQTAVYFKNYPLDTECPGNCENPDENGFMPTYGGTAGCDQTCIWYDCEYQGDRWGAGSCAPIAEENDTSTIMSTYEAWVSRLEGDSLSHDMKIIYGFENPTSANAVYPNRWGLKYLTKNGDDIEKTCDSATVYWDNGYIQGDTYTPVAAMGKQYRKVSYSLKNISAVVSPSFPINIGSYSDTQSATNGAMQAIIEKMNHQRVVMDDVGYHSELNSALSDSSEWLFINESYFGFGCDQLMIDQLAWEAATCGTCMDRVLSTWSTAEHGLSTLPYYDDLDTSVSIQDAVSTGTNLTKFAEEDIVVNFKYDIPTTSITLTSANFAFKSPNVCDAESEVMMSGSVVMTNVSFTNCGTASGSFQYTITCGAYSSDTVAITVGATENKFGWSSAISVTNCASVSSITIATGSCPEFWNSTCSWPTTLTIATPSPTKSPSAFPSKPPTTNPSKAPTKSPTMIPTISPSLPPTPAPISFFDSCTTFQVVPVRGAINNTIVHQEFCTAAKEGYYIVDINAQKPYYIIADSSSVINTTINKIAEEDYDTGTHSHEAATGSALIGHSIIMIEQWFDTLAYLGMDLTAYTGSELVTTSIKIDGLNLSTDLSSELDKSEFKTQLTAQLVAELEIENDQIEIIGLRSGSVITDLNIVSTQENGKKAVEIDVDLQNYIAMNVATDVSLSSPLNSVNSFFYSNISQDIVFTNCPYRVSAWTYEDETVIVSWDQPTAITQANNAEDIKVYQAIGEESGESFAAGSYFVRYVALSQTNASIVPKYCSFVIVVDETEWMIEFLGFEFSVTEFIIISSVLFFICCGSIIYSCIMRKRGGHKLCCCGGEKKEEEIPFKTIVVGQAAQIQVQEVEEESDDAEEEKDDVKEDEEEKQEIAN